MLLLFKASKASKQSEPTDRSIDQTTLNPVALRRDAGDDTSNIQNTTNNNQLNMICLAKRQQ